MNEDWTPERVEVLSKLWAQGMSAGEIGRHLGVTKNAVVGKVHRIGLPKRQSPIKREAGVRRVARGTPRPKAKAKSGAGAVTLNALRHGMCCWPEGEPGTDDFHFCGAPAVEGKPYCEDHCKRAYVRSDKRRDRSSEAA